MGKLMQSHISQKFILGWAYNRTMEERVYETDI